MLKRVSRAKVDALLLATAFLLAACAELALAADREPPRYAPGTVIVRLREGSTIGEVRASPSVAAVRRTIPAEAAIAEARRRGAFGLAVGAGVVVGGRTYRSIDDVPEEALFAEAYAAMSPRARRLYRQNTVTLRPGEDVTAAVAALRANAAVEHAEPNYLYETSFTPSDPRYPEQWSHHMTSAEAGWDLETGDPAVVIAIVDSGVDHTHEDLAANVWTDGSGNPGRDFTDIVTSAYTSAGFDLVPGEDYRDEDGDPDDVHGHGTHVAGIAGAVADNGVGVAGACPHCRIMPVRAGFGIELGGAFYGLLENDDVARAITWAADNGANVINMSFGSSTASQLIADAIEYARFEKGVALVAAAGNSGATAKPYPAGFDGVIAVAATSFSDGRASFSNHGLWVDVAAPGTSTLSTLPAGNLIGAPHPYGALQGTSMASPYVAGVAGLLLSRFPGLDPEQVALVLGSTGDPPATEDYIGLGRVNVFEALSIGGPTSAVAAITSPAPREALLGPAVDVLGSATGSSYVLEIGEGPYASSWSTIGAGTSVSNSVLGTVDPGTLASGETYYLRLTVSDTFDLVALRPVFAGWRQSVEARLSQAVVADLEGDGTQEIVVTAHHHLVAGPSGLYAWHHDGTPVAGFPILRPQWTTSQVPAPAVGDLEGDGTLEIACAGAEGISIFNHDGTPLAPWPAPGGSSTTPVLADIDADGDLEVVAAAFSTVLGEPAIHAWHHDRTPVAGFPIQLELPGAPAVGDLDRDGLPEIVVLDNRFFDSELLPEYEVHVFRSDGSVLPGWPQIGPEQNWWQGSDSAWKAPILADVDGNGDLEVITPLARRIVLWEHDGTAFPDPLPEDVWMGPVLADLDADGDLEIIYKEDKSWPAPAANRLLAFHHDATPVAGWPVTWSDTTSGRSSVDASLITGDLDGDGSLEVIATTRDRVRAWHADGQVVDGFPLIAPSDPSWGFEQRPTTPALGDLDGDGLLDLVAPTNFGDLYRFELAGVFAPGAEGWPMWQGDPAHRGVLAPACGNAALDPGEECDDGGDSPTCDRDCTPATCGDDTRNGAAGEDCDGLDGADAGCCTAACAFTAAGTSCDDGDLCSQLDACDLGACLGSVSPAPLCRGQTRPGGTLSLFDAGNDIKDKISWTWGSGEATSLEDFGSPTSTTDYRICAYDLAATPARLLLAKTIPAGGTCGKKPCWSALEGKGFVYKNKTKENATDIEALKLTAGLAGKAKITLAGKGDRLDPAPLPLTPTVTVQLHNQESGLCWSAEYASLIAANDGERFTAKGD